MGLQKCLCFDLRMGIIVYGILVFVLSCFSTVSHFLLSVTDDDPDQATRNTFMIGVDLLNLGCIACLIYGAHKESRTFLLPYLITQCLGLCVITIIGAIFMFQVPVAVILIFIAAIFWYVWYCILSLYQMLDPHNPNYVAKALPNTETTVYVEEQPPAYYDNKMAEAV